MSTVDLRSDTVTRPSPEMRAAMCAAEVGDDVLGDDPTVIALQEEAARLLGKEAALYFPSGTQCNQAAVRALTRRGDEVFLHAQAHIIFYEQGAASALSQVQLRVFDSPDGTLDLEKMEEYLHTDADVHWAPTRLVCLEQTHNHCGGVVVPLEHILAVREFCDRHGLKMHLDGARLFNAVGGDRRRRRRVRGALRHRQHLPVEGPRRPGRLGARHGRRDAAGRHARAQSTRRRHAPGRHHRRRRALRAPEQCDSPRRRPPPCARLAEALAALPGLEVDLGSVQTNMVFAGTRGTGVPAAELVARLAAKGVLCLDESPWSVRFVTHLDVDDEGVELAIAGVTRVLGAA